MRYTDIGQTRRDLLARNGDAAKYSFRVAAGAEMCVAVFLFFFVIRAYYEYYGLSRDAAPSAAPTSSFASVVHALNILTFIGLIISYFSAISLVTKGIIAQDRGLLVPMNFEDSAVLLAIAVGFETYFVSTGQQSLVTFYLSLLSTMAYFYPFVYLAYASRYEREKENSLICGSRQFAAPCSALGGEAAGTGIVAMAQMLIAVVTLVSYYVSPAPNVYQELEGEAATDKVEDSLAVGTDYEPAPGGEPSSADPGMLHATPEGGQRGDYLLGRPPGGAM